MITIFTSANQNPAQPISRCDQCGLTFRSFSGLYHHQKTHEGLLASIIIYNSHIPNIDAISGALITLSLSILILNSQCEEGARDGIDIWHMGIIRIFASEYFPIFCV